MRWSLELARWRTLSRAALFLSVLVAGCSQCGSDLPEKPKPPAAPQAPALSATSHTPLAEPHAQAKPVETPRDCAAAVTAFAAGDPLALRSVSSSEQTALGRDATGESVFTCLAVGWNDRRFCEVLAGEGQRQCVETWELVGKVKAQPSDEAAIELAADQMSTKCAEEFPPADCANLRAAMVTGSADRCQAVDKKIRPLCLGFATGEEKSCPAEGDCKMLVAAFKRLKKEGRAGFENSPIVDKAAREGASACAALVDELKGRCEKKE